MKALKFLSGVKRLLIGFLLVGLAYILGGCGDDNNNSRCDDIAYYGPRPCDDQYCVEQYGENWYCDEDFVIDQECNITWPTCRELKTGNVKIKN